MLKEILIADFKAESAVTKKLMERMPETQLDFKPHEKSASVLRLAAHVAALPKFIPLTVELETFDFSNLPKSFSPPMSKPELLESFDFYTKNAIDALEKIDESSLQQTIKIYFGTHLISEKTRFNEIQNLIRHIVHHRGQLSVYLRLFNIPLPNMYGPTADER